MALKFGMGFFGVFGSGIFWEVLFEALGIFLGLIFTKWGGALRDDPKNGCVAD